MSEGCEHCYASAWAERCGQKDLWNKAAAKMGMKRYVFCGSMCDVCDPDAPTSELHRLWELIEKTPNLIWMLLTKRPERYLNVVPWRIANSGHVWFGTTVESQRWAFSRLDALMELADKCLTHRPTTFLSVEPLLEEISFVREKGHAPWIPVELLIVGGESGPKARRCETAWIEKILGECKQTRTACFVKQLGANSNVRTSHPKGGDMDEWAPSLRVRQWPDSKEMANGKAQGD